MIAMGCTCGSCPQCLDAQGGRETADDGEEEDMGRRETVTAEQYADGMMGDWLAMYRQELQAQLLAAGITEGPLLSHLSGNLIYTLRHCAEAAYDAGRRAGYREARGR